MEPGSHALQVETLPHEVPINIAQFEAGARRVYAQAIGDWVESTRFRVSGILLEQAGERTRIYAAHHWWNDRDSCFVMRVSVIEGTLAQLRDPAAPIAWRTLFESRPCLPLNVDNPRGPRFEGLESGGRMLRFDADTLLLSLGDHGFDGLNRREALAQDPAASFGKLLRLSTTDGSATVHTLGHRNPQGLLRAADGTLWELEHGPHGGDELNRIVEGRNYGWPRVSYGTDYGRRSWPANPLQGRHEGYERPAFVFLPSIAVSNLVQARGGRLPLWDGDLLLGTLKGLALERVRLEDGHVQFVEPIPVGYRVRDLVIGGDGRIVLWTDERALVIVEPTETHLGDALFSQCSVCHGLNIWDASWKAPNLYRIVDRPVANADDFAYSPAMRELGGSWSRARLEAFIEDPQRFLPGTSMAFPGVRDPVERKAIVDFLVSRRDADD